MDKPAMIPPRARPPQQPHFQKILVQMARSRPLERMMRVLIILVICAGLILITAGLITEVQSFSADIHQLTQFAGGADVVFSSTLGLFQSAVLGVLGQAKPDPVEAFAPVIPVTGSSTPTPFLPETSLGAGFVPYQIEVGAQKQQAPAIEVTRVPKGGKASSTLGVKQTPTAIPGPPAVPGWIEIPRIGLDAPVIKAPSEFIELDGKTFEQFQAPSLFAAGWQASSAFLGEPGNTVLIGHHNIDGEVFGHLYQLNQGDEITVFSGNRAFHFAVSQVMKLEERFAPLDQREENAQWIMPSSDERLTLVTCWPPISNTYRLIVVAVPTN